MGDSVEDQNDGQPQEGEEEQSLKKVLKKFADSDDAGESIDIFFNDILKGLGENPENKKPYQLLASKDDFARIQSLCQTLDSRTNSGEYKKGARNNLKGKKVLVVGGGPCGLRTAIELALLGLAVVVVEKREAFTRNSVLQLWVFLVEDLKAIGFKELLPKFGLGDRLHISIRRLQLVLLKIALLLGVEVNLGVEFIKLVEPTKKKVGWKAHCFKIPKSEVVLKDYEFEAVVFANGKQTEDSGLGFEWVKIERMLAIAIAANFKNKNSRKDLQVDGKGTQGVMHQLSYFKDLMQAKGTDLENLVYLRDDTHYFVMTAKRENLVQRGVLKENTGKKTILDKDNIDQEKLQEFAKDVAAYSTEEKVPLEFFEIEGKGPDVDIFEFTSRSHAKEAALIKDVKGKKPLLVALVGDSLKQPFWPEGVGIAHGFFSAFDTVWMIYESLGEKLPKDEVLENRKETYSCLKELSKESMVAVKEYGIDPHKRYGKYRHYKAAKGADTAGETEPKTKNSQNTKTKEKKKNAKKTKTKEEKNAEDSEKVDNESQKRVSFLAEKFGGSKKSKAKKKEDTDDNIDEPKEEKRSLFGRFTAMFSRGDSGKKEKKEKQGKNEERTEETGKLKKSASAEDIRDLTDGEEKPSRGRFRSFRRSIRRLRKKKTKEEGDKVKEEKDAAENELTEKEQPAAEKASDAGESSTVQNDVDVKVEVYDK